MDRGFNHERLTVDCVMVLVPFTIIPVFSMFVVCSILLMIVMQAGDLEFYFYFLSVMIVAM